MANAYTLNSYQIYFTFVLTIQDSGLVSIFKSLETSILLTFLETSVIIYKTPLLDFYVRDFISEDGEGHLRLG